MIYLHADRHGFELQGYAYWLRLCATVNCTTSRQTWRTGRGQLAPTLQVKYPGPMRACTSI